MSSSSPQTRPKGQNPKQYVLQNFEQMKFVDSITDPEHGRIRYLASKLVCSIPAKNMTQKYEDQLIQQYQERCKIKHPHIVYTMGCETQTIWSDTIQGRIELFQVYIFFELMQLTLDELVKIRKQKKFLLPEVEAWCLVKGVIAALLQLSENLVYHGKLSLKAIFFDEEYLLYRVYDQELISGPLKNLSICQEYLKGNNSEINEEQFRELFDFISPEAKQNINEELSVIEECVNPYKCDVYAFGVILIKMLSLNSRQTVEKGIGVLQHLYSSQLMHLIKVCVQEDPKYRPDWNELSDLVQILQSQMKPEKPLNPNDRTIVKTPENLAKIVNDNQPMKTIKQNRIQKSNGQKEGTGTVKKNEVQKIDDNQNNEQSIDSKLSSLNEMIQSILDKKIKIQKHN